MGKQKIGPAHQCRAGGKSSTVRRNSYRYFLQSSIACAARKKAVRHSLLLFRRFATI
jgi:hypothetical protein